METQPPEKWGCSSAGRAPALQAGGHGFDSHHLHQSGKPGGRTSTKRVRASTAMAKRGKNKGEERTRYTEGTYMGSQLRWLERAPDKREVGGSSPLEPTSGKLPQPNVDKASANKYRDGEERLLQSLTLKCYMFIENRIKRMKSKKRTDKRTIKRFN